MGDIKVSIVCITYNQEKYIRQCLDGFMMQKTNFKFEVIISDDCSTDSTADIIKEYEKKYPNIIKPIFRAINIGSAANFSDTLSKANTKYVAICEGDDYWTDPLKLQKQFDFMEANPDYTVCTHIVKRIYEPPVLPEELIPMESSEAESVDITFNDIFTKFFHATSYFFRWNKEYINGYPKGIKYGDKYIMSLFAKHGKIKLLPEVMSVYRSNPGGVYASTVMSSDSLTFISKTCLDRMKLFKAVYNNTAPDKENFFKEVFYPSFSIHQYILLKAKDWKTFWVLTYKNADVYLFLLKHWKVAPYLIWQDIYKLLKKLYKVITKKSK